MTTSIKDQSKVVTREEWLAARLSLLEKEKALTRHRDEVAAERLALPWVEVDKTYRFTGPDGEMSLSDLFDGRSQLIVYHFMYGPDWTEGCKSCSLLGDQLDGVRVHLANHDVTLVAVSRAPLAKLDAFKRRMGWQFPWVSSSASDFNFDFKVSFTEEQRESGRVRYNFGEHEYVSDELPGASSFYRNEAGDVFHTYSVYARGLDPFLALYQVLDIAPKGRNEEGLDYPMAWVRHHDRYGADVATIKR